MASKINGWLRQRMRADGMTWLWCYQRLKARDGKMVENFLRLGLLTLTRSFVGSRGVDC
jgi:hypothetical protein